jgi:tetratricopeptide (TPR) repeat protein
MGTWSEWKTLAPLVDVARAHVDGRTSTALAEARALLAEGKAASADRRLAEVRDGAARHWIAVARADLAAIHFTTCIRGVAWRLVDATADQRPARTVDFSPEAVVDPGDVSVEAMLTNLDAAIEVGDPALRVQAQIARARTTAFVTNCAPNEQVGDRAAEFMRNDLATLAAEGHLPPDLAYVWGGVQMNEYSGAAARPFLLQAREGGYDDPSVDYLLAVISLEQRQWNEAEALALAAARRYATLGDPMQQAQCEFIRGEVRRGQRRIEAARERYEAALELVPSHAAAVLAIAGLEREGQGPTAAIDWLHGALARLMPGEALDERAARTASSNLEAAVILTDENLELSELLRDALLLDVDAEPDATRRGLRYYYAATLDVRLGDYPRASGHAALARDELAEAEVSPPVDAEQLLEQLDSAR